MLLRGSISDKINLTAGDKRLAAAASLPPLRGSPPVTFFKGGVLSSKPWYPWYPADFRAKTSHLEPLEEWAYRRLLDAYYEHRNPLPTNKDALYRISGAIRPEERAAVDKIKIEFFNEIDGLLCHQRCDDELKQATTKHQARLEAGRKGGLSNAISNAKAMLNHSQSYSQPQSQLEQSKTLFAKANGAWDDFWKLYPKKTDKKKALECWGRIKAEELPLVMDGLKRQLNCEQWRESRLIPHPSTWLRNRRWEDEVFIAERKARYE